MKPVSIPCAALAAILLLAGCSTLPSQDRLAQACPMRLARSPSLVGEGVVVNLLTEQAALALLARTQANQGGAIDPAYLNNQRATILKPDGSRATVLIPLGMAVGVGDKVAYQGGYRSPGASCSYVPNLVTRRL